MTLPRQSESPRGEPSAGWLQPLHGHWIEAALRELAAAPTVVRITVVGLRGSAPRDAGASMLVSADHFLGTIGGGHLEWHAVALARAALADPDTPTVRMIELLLGPDLGQCCGGRVELWLERLSRSDTAWLAAAAERLRVGRAATLVTDVKADHVSHRLLPALPGARLRLVHAAEQELQLFEPLLRVRVPLYIFGAGHVGQALVRLLAELAHFDITWIDSREGLLPSDLPAEVRMIASDVPARLARLAPAGTRFVVMTHDHTLDFELCRVILQRDAPGWLGLIGSDSKSARFRARLRREGLPAEALSRLHCPIGVPRISNKLPAALAIAIAAQLLQDEETEVASEEAGSCGAPGGCDSCGEKP